MALTTGATVLLRTLWIFPGCLARIRLRRATLAAWLLAALFLVWKHGFVRTDLYHAGFFFGITPVLALGLEMLPTANLSASSAGNTSCMLRPRNNSGRASRWAGFFA